jgi:hypothetical protein
MLIPEAYNGKELTLEEQATRNVLIELLNDQVESYM